ncbi:ArsR/SmtB family transcription factor [Corynebacterium liangguodongii]|uniref:Transcriptional regulator n=1 Tax=Corynebacterium liangguodongii TaxID=2079535 RepID=A0A2S0WES5_9CORY|nr:metalloregulator ArsR/SmtB family transcription factor [Corynebacterium liangguodongii]AWB84283.1 transcriptional regulator [Corynebacterium liangguodongii]PWC00292.1 ArsR family transcriptional regulator [Corynebacterium liangguodongii]
MSDLKHTIAIADEWAPTFRLLGDATRLKLLCSIHFSGQHALTVSELADATGTRLATTSAALRSLEAAGAVAARREGRSVYYAISDERVHELLHFFGAEHAAS